MRLVARTGLVLLPLITGCAQLLGIDDYESTEGAGAGASTGTETTTTGSMTQAGSTTGGPCTGDETRTCYSGPPGSELHGICMAGVQSCVEGMFGPCDGEIVPGTEDFDVTGDEDCDGVARGDVVWARPFDPTGIALELGTVVDADGNAYVFGFHEGELNFGTSPEDALPVPPERAFFLTSFDPNGTHRWSQSMPVDYDSTFGSIAIDPTVGEIYVVGLLEHAIEIDGDVLTGDRDFFLASFGLDGASHERRIITGITYEGLPVLTAPPGRLVVGGTFSASFTLDGHTITTPDVAPFVAEIDPGNLTASRLVKVGEDDAFPDGVAHLGAIGHDDAGNVFLAGDFSYFFQVGQDALTSTSVDDLDAFVVKLDVNGVTWGAHLGGGSAQDYAFTLDVAADGSLVVGGGFAGMVDYETTSGIGASLTTSAPTDYDAFVWKINAAGNTAWAKRFGDTTNQAEYAEGTIFGPFTARIGPAPQNRVALGGGFKGTVSFGGADLPSAGDFDAYLAVFDADGNHVWSKRFGNAGPGQVINTFRTTPSDELVMTLLNPAKMDLGLGEFSAVGPLQLVHAKFTP